MSIQDRVNRAVLAYMKKHGDVIDHDQAVALEDAIDAQGQAEVRFVQETANSGGTGAADGDAGKKEQTKK